MVVHVRLNVCHVELSFLGAGCSRKYFAERSGFGESSSVFGKILFGDARSKSSEFCCAVIIREMMTSIRFQ